ncbi:MAG: glycoside hydrolase family 2 protein, partial [Rhodobacteraceae bacterium]|nr:glycoside hydrolase family 2 protein [Paracoccaceae bacterium]
MANTKVYLNGHHLITHTDGYTPFEASINSYLKVGDNLLTVVLDGCENPEIPPFGGLIDYLTYAGIYRDVWFKSVPKVSISEIKAEPLNVLEEQKSLRIWCRLNGTDNCDSKIEITHILRDSEGQVVAETNSEASGEENSIQLDELKKIDLWDVENPNLYELTTSISVDSHEDTVKTSIGFRTAEFTSKGFMLNGKPLKILGLNRHQSYPYEGYAMGRRAQEKDAEILKFDLGCNLVRTSHYPQSPWFIDHCDRIGLLVFEEIPGWQYIGGTKWKQRTIENVENMIRRDWNHPSIILWGVRINESQDDHDFYVETNSLSRKLDSNRQTGGVRYITDSEFLEDVYTMNDFIQGMEELPGVNHPQIPLRKQQDVTGLNRSVPYLVTEFNGHTFPTKRTDHEQRQAEHVTRYLNILDKAYGDDEISGCIGWCFADYNTHKDFGAGDRICHHGVMDMYRNPKFASYVYSSQKSPLLQAVLKPVTHWARGERNIGGVLPLIILTNCDYVELRYGSELTAIEYPNRERFPNLPRPPVIFDHKSFGEEEMGHWKKNWENVTFKGYVGDEEVITYSMVGNPVADRMDVVPDWRWLKSDENDETRIVVKALDQIGNTLPHFDDPLSISVSENGQLIGPDMINFRGGIATFWVRSTKKKGQLKINLKTPRFSNASCLLHVI